MMMMMMMIRCFTSLSILFVISRQSKDYNEKLCAMKCSTLRLFR